MDPDQEPGPIESLEEIGAGIAHGVTRFLNSLPFLSKGAFPLIFGPILLLGAYFQALGLWNAVQADIAVQTWRPTRAVVVGSAATAEQVGYFGSSRFGNPQGAGRAATGLEVRYRYIVNGKVYTSDSFGIGPWGGYSSDSGVMPADWAEQHPMDSVISVYVNPRDPEYSAVDPRPTLTALLCMLAALPFTLIGLSGVLNEATQTRLSFEAISVGWCVLAFLIYLVGHALTLGVLLALAAFLLLLWVLHRWVAKSPLSTVEENPDAPPQDLADFYN